MFDVVYTNSAMEDQGVLGACRLDAAWGADENDFQLVLPAPAFHIEGQDAPAVTGEISGDGVLVSTDSVDREALSATVDGRAYAWNQLAQPAVSAIAAGTYSTNVYRWCPLTVGHTYLFTISEDTTGFYWQLWQSGTNTGAWTGGTPFTSIPFGDGARTYATFTANQPWLLARKTNASVTLDAQKSFTMQLHDLTLIYGAGNEPSSPGEFKSDFPGAPYPYDAGSIKSTKGKNLLDDALCFTDRYLPAGDGYILSSAECFTYMAQVERNTDYVLSVDGGNRRVVCGTDDPTGSINSPCRFIARGYAGDEIEIAFNSGASSTVMFFLGYQQRPRYIQLERGTKATQYVPFGSIAVDSVGKNKVDVDKWMAENGAAYTKDGQIYTVTNIGKCYTNPFSFSDEDIEVTLSCIDFVSNGVTNPRFDLLNSKGSLVGTLGDGAYNKTPKTVMACKLRMNYTAWNKSSFNFSGLMLEIGSGATGYEPHKHSRTAIELLDKNAFAGTERTSMRLTATGDPYGEVGYSTSYAMPVIAGTVVTKNTVEDAYHRWVFLKKDTGASNWVAYTDVVQVSNPSMNTQTVPNGAKFARICYVAGEEPNIFVNTGIFKACEVASLPNGVKDTAVVDSSGKVTIKKRVGVVDLGSFNWNQGGDLFSVTFRSGIGTGSDNNMPNIVCAALTPTFGNNFGNTDNCITLGSGSSDIYCKATKYKTAAEFKAAMQGVLMLYELKEPMEIEAGIAELPDVYANGSVKIEASVGTRASIRYLVQRETRKRIVQDVPSIDFRSLVYVAGTQIGGVVDDKSPDGNGAGMTVTYHGRTWHGVMAYSIIQPDAGEDYYEYSGDANDVIRAVIERQGLGSIFECDGNSGITVRGRFDRYVDMYEGLTKMLSRDSDTKAKLEIFKMPGGKVSVRAVEAGRYVSDLDSDRYGFKSLLDSRPVNHLVCLGGGELKERDVIDLYADEDGNVSRVQSLFGIDEKSERYESSGSGHDELLEAGTKKLEELQESSSIEMTLADDEGAFDVGDVVGALDNISGIYVEAAVSKVVARIDEDGVSTYSYEVGAPTTSRATAAHSSL